LIKQSAHPDQRVEMRCEPEPPGEVENDVQESVVLPRRDEKFEELAHCRAQCLPIEHFADQ
jgi:hypothetical protein